MTKVHLDTDLGGDIDDLCALALLLKWPDVELAGVTVVGDDQGQRTKYTKYALKVAGIENIPVMTGADISLGCYRMKLGYQGEDYWPQNLPSVNNSLDDALDLLKRSIDDGAIIIGIGPFTNLYLLDKKYPGILKKAKLFLMGGYVYPPRQGYPQWQSNYDFNIQVDVRSSQHVLENSTPTLIPLSVTVETYLRRSYLDALRNSDDLGKLIAKQAEVFAVKEKIAENHTKDCEKLPKDIINFLHDPLAVAIALGWKEEVVIERLPLNFEVKDSWLYETIDDANPKNQLNVVTSIDGDKFSEYWLKAVTSL